MQDVIGALKPSLVGGYDKESVLKTIEELLEALRDAQTLCEQQRAHSQSLAERNDAMNRQNAALTESMQGLNQNMHTLLQENKQLASRVAYFETLRAAMEADANDIVQEAQAQAWIVEQESRKLEARITAEAEAALRENTRAMEDALLELVTIAESVGEFGNRVSTLLMPCSKPLRAPPIKDDDAAAQAPSGDG